MDAFYMAPTEETPGVHLDKAGNQFRMWGKSLPEDVASFFEPVMGWLHNYQEVPNQATVFDFRMAYFNTASSKIILDILRLLENLHRDGTDVRVTWTHREDDEDMEEAGEEYSEIVELPFDLVAT